MKNLFGHQLYYGISSHFNEMDVEVNGKTITFKTYAVGTAKGVVPGAAEGYIFNKNTPYDSITVTK